ncbi:MAG: hypothetical protein RMJ19_10280 [Gemmatales bacterium]|nr:hypothetical protein [Gemmatales bacterium]MCS7160845.1 hypothetical protein [Gemmatales bacterium]MDW8176047.1 hypothetical protein [Gemmatales bacterium]MDW8222495.1 hypothetical protein [Gemmatales bacterium]
MAHTSRWQVGDRVLAPWEPDFLYPGTVAHVGRRGVVIEYDDGDEGYVPESVLRPLRLEVGSQVQVRRDPEVNRYYWGEVLAVQGERVLVRYSDDDGEETIPIGRIRIPRVLLRLPREQEEELTALWKPGDRVLAPWEPHFLYPGTIRQIESGIALIDYDDGDVGPVSLAELMPLHLEVGMRVQARRNRFEKVYEPGTLTAVEGESITVCYDADQTEDELDIAYIRLPRDTLV